MAPRYVCLVIALIAVSLVLAAPLTYSPNLHSFTWHSLTLLHSHLQPRFDDIEFSVFPRAPPTSWKSNAGPKAAAPGPKRSSLQRLLHLFSSGSSR